MHNTMILTILISFFICATSAAPLPWLQGYNYRSYAPFISYMYNNGYHYETFGRPYGGKNTYDPGYESKLRYYGMLQDSCHGAPDGLYYVDSYTFAYCSHGHTTRQPCAQGAANPPLEYFTSGGYYGFRDFCSVNLLAYGYRIMGVHTPYRQEPKHTEKMHVYSKHREYVHTPSARDSETLHDYPATRPTYHGNGHSNQDTGHYGDQDTNHNGGQDINHYGDQDSSHYSNQNYGPFMEEKEPRYQSYIENDSRNMRHKEYAHGYENEQNTPNIDYEYGDSREYVEEKNMDRRAYEESVGHASMYGIQTRPYISPPKHQMQNPEEDSFESSSESSSESAEDEPSEESSESSSENEPNHVTHVEERRRGYEETNHFLTAKMYHSNL